MSRLLLKESGGERSLDITDPVLEIGRGQDNQVVIGDPRSSRRHCRLTRTPQGWVLEDLKSRNGTTLNGLAVTRVFLKHGDEIGIGSTRIRFEEEGPAAAQEPGPGKAEVAAAPPAEVVVEKPSAEESAAAREESAAPPEESGFYLEGTEGPFFGQRIPLEKFPFTIGRKKDNDFCLQDPRASGSHARIVRRGKRYFLEDLGSRNGTLVNHHKVREARLSQGAVIKIGESSFRLEMPPSAREPDISPGEVAETAAHETGAQEIGADDFRRLDTREVFQGYDRAGSPIAVAAILLVLGTILYFAVDITLKSIRRTDPDPSPEGNCVVNWSFEESREDGGIPGWAMDGNSGRLAVAREGAQYPGLQALQVIPSGAGFFRASSSADIAVEPRREYRLSAHVTNLGAFAAGVSVSWLQEGTGGREEVGRDWGTALREDVREDDLDRTVRAPESALFARIRPFVLATGGSPGGAAFDRIFFGPAPEETAPAQPPDAGAEGEGAADGETVEPVLPLEIKSAGQEAPSPGGPRTLPIRLLAASDGSLKDVRRGPRTMVQTIWMGLAGDSDPLALGTRLLTRPRTASEREGAILVSQLPDVARGEWYPVELRAQAQGSEIRWECRIGRSRATGGTPAEKAQVYLELPLTEKEITAFGASLKSPATFPADLPVDQVLDEILFGFGSEQIALLFRPAVKLRSMPHPDVQGRSILVAEASLAADPGSPGLESGTRLLSIRLSPFSRREEEAAAALLKEAEGLYQTGKPLDGRERLEELRRRFPWRSADLARAQEVEKRWSVEVERALKTIQDGVEDLPASPSPVIAGALLGRISGLRNLLKGMPAERTLDELEGRIRKLMDRPAADAAGKPSLLQEARAHLDRGETGMADLFLSLARREKLSDDDEEVARHLAGLIAERRKQRSIEEVR